MKLLTAIAAICLVLSACGETIKGNGNVTTQSRDVSDFHSVEASGFFEIELMEGTEGVEIVTDENLHEHIEVEVKNGSLRIYTNDKMLDAKELLVKVSFEQLNSVDIAGAAQITCKSPIQGESFELEVAGAAEAELDVDVKNLSLDLAGGSEVEVVGNATMADFDIAGAGEVRALDLQTQQCSIDISGAGEIEVSVAKALDVDITGAGEVRYKGNPDDIKKSITGAGELTQL